MAIFIVVFDCILHLYLYLVLSKKKASNLKGSSLQGIGKLGILIYNYIISTAYIYIYIYIYIYMYNVCMCIGAY